MKALDHQVTLMLVQSMSINHTSNQRPCVINKMQKKNVRKNIKVGNQTRTGYMPSCTSELPLLLPREWVVWCSMGAVNLAEAVVFAHIGNSRGHFPFSTNLSENMKIHCSISHPLMKLNSKWLLKEINLVQQFWIWFRIAGSKKDKKLLCFENKQFKACYYKPISYDILSRSNL